MVPRVYIVNTLDVIGAHIFSDITAWYFEIQHKTFIYITVSDQ